MNIIRDLVVRGEGDQIVFIYNQPWISLGHVERLPQEVATVSRVSWRRHCRHGSARPGRHAPHFWRNRSTAGFRQAARCGVLSIQCNSGNHALASGMIGQFSFFCSKECSALLWGSGSSARRNDLSGGPELRSDKCRLQRRAFG